MKNLKILFLLKKRSLSYGPSFGLKCSCKMIIGALAKHGIEGKIVEVIDNNSVEKEVVQYSPTHVFIEALWIVSSKIDLLVNKYKKIQWFVRLHSDSPFLQREGIAILWLKEYNDIIKHNKNFHIACNSKRLQKELKLGPKIDSEYAPNIYYPESYPLYHKKKRDNYLDISSLGAIRELKAHLPQALAAMVYGNINGIKIRFHINGNRLEGSHTDGILKNLINLFKDTQHELIIHDWMDHDSMIKFIQKQIDIGMAVSFSETFCITAYDHSTNNIPVVGSKEIKYILPIFKADPTDLNSMLKALDAADSSRFNGLHKLNRLLLQWGNYWATKDWLYLLQT